MYLLPTQTQRHFALYDSVIHVDKVKRGLSSQLPPLPTAWHQTAGWCPVDTGPAQRSRRERKRWVRESRGRHGLLQGSAESLPSPPVFPFPPLCSHLSHVLNIVTSGAPLGKHRNPKSQRQDVKGCLGTVSHRQLLFPVTCPLGLFFVLRDGWMPSAGQAGGRRWWERRHPACSAQPEPGGGQGHLRNRRGHAQGATVCRESAGGERKSVPAFEMPQRRGSTLEPGWGRGGAETPLSDPCRSPKPRWGDA